MNSENNALMQDMTRCQHELHKWSKANQISFDPLKKIMHMLALHEREGSKFRLLGVPFDNALSMKKLFWD